MKSMLYSEKRKIVRLALIALRLIGICEDDLNQDWTTEKEFVNNIFADIKDEKLCVLFAVIAKNKYLSSPYCGEIKKIFSTEKKAEEYRRFLFENRKKEERNIEFEIEAHYIV
ncbi:MAG: hypothetical protein IPO06_09230 [Leptospiraceae bacterium]|nr:hypothetical protein [Leptospiraceae bacterium]